MSAAHIHGGLLGQLIQAAEQGMYGVTGHHCDVAQNTLDTLRGTMAVKLQQGLSGHGIADLRVHNTQRLRRGSPIWLAL